MRVTKNGLAINGRRFEGKLRYDSVRQWYGDARSVEIEATDDASAEIVTVAYQSAHMKSLVVTLRIGEASFRLPRDRFEASQTKWLALRWGDATDAPPTLVSWNEQDEPDAERLQWRIDDPEDDSAALSFLANACEATSCRVAVGVHVSTARELAAVLRGLTRARVQLPNLSFTLIPEHSLPRSSAKPKPSGRLPMELIFPLVQDRYGDMDRCYGEALALDSKLRGIVGVTFTIQRDGRVDDAAVTYQTLNDRAFHQCLVSAFNRLVFPAPTGGIVKVYYPIEFVME